MKQMLTGEDARRSTSTLKLSRVLFGPALDDYFFLGVELDGIAALAVHDSEKAVFPAAEWEVRHGRGDADIDADISGGGFIAKAAGGRAAGSEQRSLIAVWIALEESHRLV